MLIPTKANPGPVQRQTNQANQYVSNNKTVPPPFGTDIKRGRNNKINTPDKCSNTLFIISLVTLASIAINVSMNVFLKLYYRTVYNGLLKYV